jgi:ABC-type glycerol-3-phosphate transport system permease component
MFGQFWVYALLFGGAAIFSWPFLWMTSTSVKVEREIFGGALRLRPESPRPALRSPYLEPRVHQDLDVPRKAELLPGIESALVAVAAAAPDAPWSAEVGAAGAAERAALARTVLRRIHLRTPAEEWERPASELNPLLAGKVTPALVGEAVVEVRRELGLGAVRARSIDLEEAVLVAPEQVADGWQITGPARLEPARSDTRNYARVRYDFTDGAREIRLARTLVLGFPVEKLQRIQIAIRPDDSWHPLTCYVEKGGVRYRAERTFDLANEEWGVVTWQEPGPDDQSNQIRKWILLREVGRGPSFESAPDRMRIELVMERASGLAAWWAKIRRNYQLALDYLPFWRYVATSLFLVLLNIAGTLFSCSLVAYAFARLQWPGREFSFALMLATMMVPRPGHHDPALPDHAFARPLQHAHAALDRELLCRGVQRVPAPAVHERHPPRSRGCRPDRRMRFLARLLAHHAAARETDPGRHRDFHVHGCLERFHGPADLSQRPEPVPAFARPLRLQRPGGLKRFDDDGGFAAHDAPGRGDLLLRAALLHPGGDADGDEGVRWKS